MLKKPPSKKPKYTKPKKVEPLPEYFRFIQKDKGNAVKALLEHNTYQLHSDMITLAKYAEDVNKHRLIQNIFQLDNQLKEITLKINELHHLELTTYQSSNMKKIRAQKEQIRKYIKEESHLFTQNLRLLLSELLKK